LEPDSTAEDFGERKEWHPATDQLVVELYPQLRLIARREHVRVGAPMTLQTTALIHESYLKLRRREGWSDRAHFLGCAATAMRHVLIDAARARLAAKRDGGAAEWPDEAEDRELVKLGEALKELAAIDPELTRIVECRFFAGYDEIETAEVLRISDRTVRRRWVRAKAWLYSEMAKPDGPI